MAINKDTVHVWGMIARVVIWILLSYVPFGLDGDTSSYYKVIRAHECVGVIDATRKVGETNVQYTTSEGVLAREGV